MKNKIAKGTFGGIFLFAILVLSFLLFTERINGFNEKDVQKQLVEVAENNAQLIRTMFHGDILELEHIASYWERKQVLKGEEILEYLIQTGETSRYLYLGFDLPDGTSYTSKGDTLDVSHLGYLEEVWKGDPILTNSFVSEYGKEKVFAIIVPVYQEGKIIAALRAVCDSTMLDGLVTMETFQGQGYFNIVSAEGDFIKRSPKIEDRYEDTNLFEFLKEVSAQDAYGIQKLKTEMEAMKPTSILMNVRGEKQSVCFAPVGLGKWYACSAVPITYWTVQKDRINRTVAILLLVIGVIYIALMYYIIWQNKNTRSKIGEERDYLERVLNNIPLPVFITDENRFINFVNAAAVNLFHFSSAKDLKGKPCCCFHTDICQSEDCAIEKMERTGNCIAYYEKDHKNYMVSTAVLAEAAQGDGKYIEVIQDITEIAQIQKILEEKTLELETINENLSCGLLITKMDAKLTVLRCNQNYCDLVLKKEEEIIGKSALDCVAQEDRNRVEVTISAQLQQQQNVFCEHKILQTDGKTIWVSLHGKQTVLQDEVVGVWLLTDSSEMHHAQKELMINLERYRIAMQNTTDILVDYDIINKRIYHSSKATEIYGVPKLVENAPEALIERGTVLEESAPDFLALFEKVRAGEAKCSCVIKSKAADGKIVWNRLLFTTVFDEEKKPVRAIGMIQDITREKMAETQYKRETRFRELDTAENSVYYEANLTQHCFISGHEAILTACHHKSTDDFDEITSLMLQHLVMDEDREMVASQILWNNLMQTYGKGVTNTTFQYRRNIGTGHIWVECAIHIFEQDETKDLHVVGCIRDINEAKLKQLELQFKAERDLLTGLYNKVTMQRFITESLAKQSEHLRAAFLLIDLDNFKTINDTMGHAFGDTVLIEVAKCLRDHFEKEELTGRLGGDEFGIFLTKIESKDQVREIAHKVCEMFHHLYVGEVNYKVSGTIGVAMFPENGNDLETLYRHADEALYHAKKLGKDTFAFYESEEIQEGK